MQRVLHRDTIPYETPSSLSGLRGSVDGVIDLPLSVYWGPERKADLTDPDQLLWAYRAIVQEGTQAVQEAMLNESLLRSVWWRLWLPDRCRAVWEAKFPDLVK